MRFKTPVKGVHIGSTCVDGSDWQPDEVAHAHTSETGPKHVGFICARTLSDLRTLLVHEIAHLASDSGHDDKWRRSVHRLGGRVPAAYKKRHR